MGRYRSVWMRWVVATLVGVTIAGCTSDGPDGEDDALATQTTTTTSTIAAPTTLTPVGEAELQAVVADAWSAIWVRDWDTLLDVYAEPCRSELSPSDLDATLGQGITALTEGGTDPTLTTVKVDVLDLVEGESASVVSFLRFEGFDEAQEDDTGSWVVESNEWRRTDCADLLGAGAGGGDVSGDDTAEIVSGVGTPNEPSSFGGVFEFEGWRGTVLDVIDAAPYLASFSDPVPDGETYLVVVSELHYLGGNFAEPDPFLVRAIGSTDYESFGNGCALDSDLLAAQNIQLITAAMPGQMLRTASCLSVPTSEIPTMQIVLENAFAIADPEIHFSVAGADPDPLAEPTVPVLDPAADARRFGEVADFGSDFTGTVVSLHDGIEEGLISEFSDKPPAGSTYAVVIWEGTYTGTEVASDPFVAVGLGSGAYESLSSPCSLDLTAVEAAHDVSGLLELEPNQTFRGATCWTVPTGELATVVVQLDNVFDFEVAPVRFAP